VRRKLSLNLILPLVLILFLLFTSRAYFQQVFSFHFVDEEDNFTLGNYLLKGDKLYTDLFSHHQPLGYVFSAAIQKVTHPNTIPSLIKKHRQAMVVWSLIWYGIIFARFRLKAAPFIAIFELTKLSLLGNLFLSESLIAYPLIYLSLAILGEESFKTWEQVFVGFCFGLSVFLLSPIWPLLLVLGILFILKEKKTALKSAAFVLLGALPVALLILPFIGVSQYFHDAFYINLHYYIPLTSDDPMQIAVFKGMLAPIFSLVEGLNSPTGILIKILSAIFIVQLAILVKKGDWRKALIAFLVLGSANIRYIRSGQEYYTGFHLLPWFAVLITLTGWMNLEFFKNAKKTYLKILFALLLFLPLAYSLFSASKLLFPKRDTNLDLYINYSRQSDAGDAIKIMKAPGDTLFVAPDEWLVFWEAQINHSGKMLNYYAWNAQVPELRDSVSADFKNNPPTFVYCDCNGDYLGLSEPLKNYRQLNKDKNPSHVYILSSKMASLGKDQLNKLSFYGYSLP